MRRPPILKTKEEVKQKIALLEVRVLVKVLSKNVRLYLLYISWQCIDLLTLVDQPDFLCATGTPFKTV